MLRRLPRHLLFTLTHLHRETLLALRERELTVRERELAPRLLLFGRRSKLKEGLDAHNVCVSRRRPCGGGSSRGE